MNKAELQTAVDNVKNDTKEALETLYGELNHGQQKRLLKVKRRKNSLTGTG